ncbi:MAG: exopolyphosphatase [Natronospirillum sp.]|uniref:exopolyphosphatase n=1 Tax=Natronospirillum sp. TaxID=2812955 RepID=UPI0025CC3C43|nr:exopolyphosphatase [Natronospirillum sp.]MCH8553162.1 exopolyphosphatase [Natronospirillum sp.]
MGDQFRLVTRSDFDGLVCAALLKELDMIDDILFVHPKDMQDGKIEITDRDITTNLPYVPGVYLAFDHHFSETLRNAKHDNHIIHPDAPSAARVVFDHYGGDKTFKTISNDLMEAVDKGDSAQFSAEEILHPQGWVLLNFLMDARTGLGRFRTFRISNYQLMMQLIDACREMDIDRILELPDVAERVELYREHEPMAIEQISRCAEVKDNIVLLNLQQEDPIWPTNRFTVYALFPECNVSIHRMWGRQQKNTVFAIGKSILNRSSEVNIGAICLHYGGGGHEAAGTCQVDNSEAERVEAELIEKLAD